MAEVLVTGATGFVGYHVVRALAARGDDVVCLVRKTSKTARIEPLGVRFAHGDVNDPASLPAAVAGRSIVYHVAGCTRHLHRRELQVNQDGCRNVAEACAAQGNPPVLLSISSLAAAGPSPRDRLRTESDPIGPVSNYGRSKRAGELALERFADRVPITVLRPGIVLGEADEVGLALFRMIGRLGIHLVPGWKPRRFSVIHAADLSQLMILAAERGERLAPPPPRDGETTRTRGYYFAACDEHPTFGELGKMIGKALGRRFTFVKHVALPVAWLVAAGTEVAAQIVRRPFVFRMDKYREARAGAWACSPQKAMDQLGFSAGSPLVDRLRETAEWYRAEGWL